MVSLVWCIVSAGTGDALTDVARAKFAGEPLPVFMRTSIMVFCPKPRKAKSILTKDKRRLSLLNSDFKVIESVEARRMRKIEQRVLSSNQYVSGKDKNIHHGICKVRNAINEASRTKNGCGIADMDFLAAFDWMVLKWVWMVLRKLGLDERVVGRLKSLYENWITIVSVNNTFCRVIPDVRGSLKQGGMGSMDWFSF